MKSEEYAERLKEALGPGLKSLVLYGSAAAGDHVGKYSDYNLLLVAEKLDVSELKEIGRASKPWLKAGNPPPMLFTLEHLRRSADVFPIEFLDIQQSHRILAGADVVGDLEISRDHLRLQLERELKGKLIQVMTQYLATGGKPKPVADLLLRSFSTFAALFRGVLRLFRDKVPAQKAQVLEALAECIAFDKTAFEEIGRLRTGALRLRDVDPNSLFDEYVKAVGEVVEAVDAFAPRPGKGE